MSGKKFVTFVTGNAKKLAEVQDIIGDAIPLVSRSLDLPELQGTPEDVSREKCKLAAKAVEGPVLVEDTSLCFNALNGLPGVYIKWFMEGIGHEGLNNLLAAYPDKTAYAQCIFSFSEGKDAEPQPKNFGWDPIFEPQGFGKTYAEMDPAVKNSISHRYRSLEEVKRFFAANPQVLQASAAPPPP